MSLRILSGRSATKIFSAFAENIESNRAFLWLTHRIHRDILFERAAKNGHPGWLNPPLAFFSELPARFGLKRKTISLLDRRSLINRLANSHGARLGIALPAARSIGQSSMLDSFFAELLPEGITAAQLRASLAVAGADDFAERRNAWIVDVYDSYLHEFEQRGLYDDRAVHSLIAEQIDAGALPKAVNGADSLHIYGLYSARTRKQLLRALASQQEIQVTIYTTTAAAAEFADINCTREDLGGDVPPARVQPAPDAWLEAEWVAGEAKKLIVQQGVEPHDIAVVARTGREDTRRLLQVFLGAGIPATARVRTPLAEIAAIKAVLTLFQAAAEEWPYQTLRRLVTNPYFKLDVDPRTLDRIARDARPSGIASWLAHLEKAIRHEQDAAAADVDEDHKAGYAVRIDMYEKALANLSEVRPTLELLDAERAIPAWIDVTRDIIANGWFELRSRICRPPMERNDVVRVDQRGIRLLETLMGQWRNSADDGAQLSAAEWFALLRTLLRGQDLVLTTPGQKGVQILEAHDAALIPFHTTFLVHANDAVFPRSAPTSGLFTDEEKDALHRDGLPVDTFDTALARETALWSAVTSGEKVVITYRTTDPKGTPLLASLLVPDHNVSDELPRTGELVAEPLNLAAERYRAAYELGRAVRKGTVVETIPAPDPAAMRHAILQAYAEQERGAPERTTLQNPFNAWNGVLRDPLVLGHLRAQYGPEHTWSASQLELYAKCPFFYLTDRVLRLKEVEEAEEETNMLTSGGVAHDILEEFYNELKAILPTDVATATRIFSQAAARVFGERESSGEWLGLPALWQQRKRWIVDTVADFIQYDLKSNIGKVGDTPWRCEHVLGGADGIAELTGKDLNDRAVRMLLRGRIDRIDKMKKDGYRVIDYKSNMVPSGKTGFSDGAVLQGVIYIAALIQEGVAAVCSEYRSIKGQKNGAAIKVGEEEYNKALAIAFSLPQRIRDGYFEANLAASSSWAPWFPDASVTRTRAQLAKGETRFK